MKLTAKLLKQLIKEAMQDDLEFLRDLKYKQNLTPEDHKSIRALYSQARQANDVVTMQYIESIGIYLEEYLGTWDFVFKALKDFIAETPALAKGPSVAEDIDDDAYTMEYQDRSNNLVLGTIIDGGGDRLYHTIAAADPGFKNLLAKMHDYAVKYGKPVKRPRKFGVIPYTDHYWNEDDWGEDL